MSAAVLSRLNHTPSSEVIDVDLIEDDQPSRSPPSRRRRTSSNSWVPIQPSSGARRSDRTVIVIDSDEEGVDIPSSSSRRLRSPPPPARDSVPPPVPPLPLPLSSSVQGVICPSDSSFLQRLSARIASAASARPSTSRHAANTAAATPRAAPPSHHMPSMGLGGALLSMIGPSTQQRHRDTLEARRRQWQERMERTVGSPWAAFDWWFSDDEDSGARVFTTFRAPYNPLPDDRWNDPWADVWAATSRPQRSTYNVEYTHKDPQPAPGFTYDFDPAEKEREAARRRKVAAGVLVLDDSGEVEIEEATPAGVASSSYSSNDMTSTLLICASCSDPLVRGGSGSSRLYALRCGHMLDEKCVHALMRPHEPEAPQALPEEDAEFEPEAVKPIDRKGKGKAVVVEDEGAEGSPASSMRNRLRPRRQTAFPEADASPKPTRAITARAITRRKGRRARAGKGKGKAKVSSPIVLAEHTWMCPVVGCHRQHISELLEGGEGHEGKTRWAHREGQGAVQVFA